MMNILSSWGKTFGHLTVHVNMVNFISQIIHCKSQIINYIPINVINKHACTPTHIQEEKSIRFNLTSKETKS